MTPDGLQNPTLHVNPGDHLMITVTNNLDPGTGSMGVSGPNCGASSMNSASLNIHYHGTNTSPTCHQDEVIKTIINPRPNLSIQRRLSRRTNRRGCTGTTHIFTASPSTRCKAERRGRSSWKASRTCSRP